MYQYLLFITYIAGIITGFLLCYKHNQTNKDPSKKPVNKGDEVGYLCYGCDNTTFIVIDEYGNMKCSRCGYEENYYKTKGYRDE